MTPKVAQRKTGWHGPRRQDFGTPLHLFEEIQRRYGRECFTLDPCASKWNAKVPVYMDEEIDGLKAPWGTREQPLRAFVNPPYNAIGKWMAKALVELWAGNIELACFLVPVRSDQAWHHDYVIPWATRVDPIRGRVPMVTPPGAKKVKSPFEASQIVVFEHLINAADFRGDT